MKTVSFFHKETGLFSPIQLTVSDPYLIALNTPDDHIAIDGHHDHLSKRVDIDREDGADPIYTLVDWIPPSPSAYHDVWNPTTKRWELNAEAQEKLNRSESARGRTAELEKAQHQTTRELLLGDESARKRLQEIHDEIESLKEQL